MYSTAFPEDTTRTSGSNVAPPTVDEPYFPAIPSKKPQNCALRTLAVAEKIFQIRSENVGIFH